MKNGTEQEQWVQQQRDAEADSNRQARRAFRQDIAIRRQANRAAARQARGGRDWYKHAVMAAVILVAAIAAAVSFLHIRDVAIHYGQPQMAAYLMPVSVDGLVTVCSVALLRAARLGLSAPGLARSGLAFGVLATLAANAVAGLAHGWPGAVVSAWAPVSFVIAAEVAISMSGQKRRQPQRTADTASKRTQARPRTRKPQARGEETRAAVIAAPDLPATQLATQLGVSTRTVRRHRAMANGST